MDPTADPAPPDPAGQSAADHDLPWQPGWTLEERESFFAAIARHERASWRVSIVAGAGILVLAFIVAVLMAPILYALLGTLPDLVNLAIPMPDLTRTLMRRLGDVVDQMGRLPWTRWLAVTAVASIPGVLLMGLVIATPARALRAADDLDTGALPVRRPQPTQLAEQRFANVVAEMAVAAAIPEPRVLIAERGSRNAVVLGADAGHVTIVVARSCCRGCCLPRCGPARRAHANCWRRSPIRSAARLREPRALRHATAAAPTR